MVLRGRLVEIACGSHPATRPSLALAPAQDARLAARRRGLV